MAVRKCRRAVAYVRQGPRPIRAVPVATMAAELRLAATALEADPPPPGSYVAFDYVWRVAAP